MLQPAIGLVQQARILQRSGRLVRERLEELSTGGAEEVVLSAVEDKDAEGLVPADQWKRPCALQAQADEDVPADERRVGGDVVHHDGESGPDGPTARPLAGRRLIPAGGEVSQILIS